MISEKVKKTLVDMLLDRDPEIKKIARDYIEHNPGIGKELKPDIEKLGMLCYASLCVSRDGEFQIDLSQSECDAEEAARLIEALDKNPNLKWSLREDQVKKS